VITLDRNSPNFCCSECAASVWVLRQSPWRRIAERFCYALLSLLNRKPTAAAPIDKLCVR